MAPRIVTLDISDQSQIRALRQRLSGKTFEMLFVNAGITNNEKKTIADVTTDEFIRVMVTNALSPMRVIESLGDLVSADGLIGVMSSGQSSVANNITGMREVYRGISSPCAYSVRANFLASLTNASVVGASWPASL